MNCPNCHQPTEADAVFCGNCGQQLRATDAAPTPASGYKLPPPVSQPGAPVATPAVPAYAHATQAQHTTETKAQLSVLFGAIGIVGALFMPLIGLALGIASLVMGTLSRGAQKRQVSTLGLVVGSIAVIVGLGTWAHTIRQDPRFNHDAKTAKQNQASVVTADLSTPCYSVNFIDRLNIVNSSKSCAMSAYNGDTLDTSSNAYKVYSSKTEVMNTQSFTALAKQALHKDIEDSLPGFTIDSERVSGFAGSPAYTVNASNKAQGVAVVETAVLHQVKSGDNVFILLHAVNGGTADLRIMEAQWQWK